MWHLATLSPLGHDMPLLCQAVGISLLLVTGVFCWFSVVFIRNTERKETCSDLSARLFGKGRK